MPRFLHEIQLPNLTNVIKPKSGIALYNENGVLKIKDSEGNEKIIATGELAEIGLNNYYTKAEIESLLSGVGAGGFELIIVNELPATGSKGKMYLVPNDEGTYTEYVFIANTNKWETIGTTNISQSELEDYYNKDYIDENFVKKETLNEYAKKDEIPTDYITESDLNGYAKTEDIPVLPEGKIATEAWVEGKNYLTEHQSLEGYLKTDSKIPFSNITNHPEIPTLEGLIKAGVATENYVKTEIADLVKSAPETLDTLEELATAVSGNKDILTTLQEAIGNKANASDVSNLRAYIDDNFIKDEDLPSLDDLEGYAKESWVTSQGYLTEPQVDTKLENYLTKDSTIDYSQIVNHPEIPNVDDFLTEEDINEKGYLVSTDLENYTKNTDFKTINGETIIGDGNIAIDLEVDFQDKLKDYYTSKEIDDKKLASETWVSEKIDEKVEGLISGEINLDKYAEKENVYTKTEIDNKGFLTEHQSLEGYAKETYVDQKVAELVKEAPELLDTLEELSKALGNDPNFATTITTEISKKANSTDVYTKTEVDTAISDAVGNIEIPDVDITGQLVDYAKKDDLKGLASEKWVNEQEFLKEDALNDYVRVGTTYSKEEVNTKFSNYTETKDLSTYIEGLGYINTAALAEALKLYVSKEEIKNMEIGGKATFRTWTEV